MLIVTAGLVYVEYRLQQVPNSYSVKRYDFEKQLDSIQVVVLGTSHSEYGVNPEYFSHYGFVLGTVGQDMYYSTALLNKYLTQLPKLKLVIIECDYMAFNYSLSKVKEDWRTSSYYRFWGVKSDNWDPFQIRNYSIISLYTNSLVKEIIKKGFDTNLAVDLNYNGWRKITVSKNDDRISEQLGKARVLLYDTIMANNHDNGRIRKYLENMLDELNRRKIKAALITMPVYSTYSKFCNADILNKNRSYIDSLCNKYGCTYNDYFKDSRFSKDDFYDNDHLNLLGAEKCSKIIDAEIVSKAIK
jgi:hypothetical protein